MRLPPYLAAAGLAAALVFGGTACSDDDADTDTELDIPAEDLGDETDEDLGGDVGFDEGG